MGKTRNDEEYERGIHDGQKEDLLGDSIQGLIKSGSPYDKGYDYGATHRYGPKGRYHTWDGRGSNDPKDNSSSSGGGGGGGGFPSLRGCLVGFVIVILLIGFVIHILNNVVIPKIETDVIKKIWPTYETSSEKALKIKQETEAEEKRIFTSLDKWLGKWIPIHLKNSQKIDPYLNNCGYKYLARLDNNIWVIAHLPYDEPGQYYSNVYIFHSSDDSSSWRVAWKRPATRRWSGVDLEGIKVIDEQTVCVKLYIHLQYKMLYTIDGGKNWQIDEKLNPLKVKNYKQE